MLLTANDCPSMSFSTFFLILKAAAAAGIIILIVKKHRIYRSFKEGYQNQFHVRWLSWYGSFWILGTSSPDKRAFMKKNNQLSTLIWICILVFVGLFLLPALIN